MNSARDETPIVPQGPPRKQSRVRIYLFQDVAGDRYLQAQLMMMTVLTGTLDAMTYTTYGTFTSKQSGNGLFLALYCLQAPSLNYQAVYNVSVSMGTFFIGAFIWGQMGRVSCQRRRIWLLASQLFQSVLILAATAVRYWAMRDFNGPDALGVLALLSLAMSWTNRHSFECQHARVEHDNDHWRSHHAHE